MNCAGSQKIVLAESDQIIFFVLFRTLVPIAPFRTFVSVDTLSVWGLAYVYNQQRKIPRRQRTSRFPPGDCCCFPPKIVPVIRREPLRARIFSLRSWSTSSRKFASRERQISRLSYGSGSQEASILKRKTYASIVLKRKELFAACAPVFLVVLASLQKAILL